jgi:MoaA/NifB/PqqE/SkfB family radical SAM enzyme
MSLPIDAVIAITYRCDSRCNMCNIWRLPKGDELAPEEYRRLPSSLRDINITGGEPFLRDDIVEIVRIMDDRCNHPRIVISTNGFERRRIMHAAPLLMKISGRIGLAVSLDGIGEKHDEIRGVPGGFDKVLETLRQLRTMGYRNVRVAFTAQRNNTKHLGAVYDLSRQVGYQFTTSVAQNSEFYFSTGQNQTVDPLDLEGELRYVMRKELLSVNPKCWLRAYFYVGVLRYNISKERILACLTLNRSMGGIRERAFDEIWNGEAAAGIRSGVDRCAQPCWMICTARTAMLRRPHEPARWILANWLRILAGREVG